MFGRDGGRMGLDTTTAEAKKRNKTIRFEVASN